MNKLFVVVNHIEMARVTGVPLNFILTRGQQIKVRFCMFVVLNIVGCFVGCHACYVTSGIVSAYAQCCAAFCRSARVPVSGGVGVSQLCYILRGRADLLRAVLVVMCCFDTPAGCAVSDRAVDLAEPASL
jgi:hypothetical protein